ncbi:IS110 family transposase [Reichenbachiella sp.]|uniref:IS110 family transposase n=1 Tax=Reichenbachiella sp. TaxID=2184521 RepID=UPI003B5AB5DE
MKFKHFIGIDISKDTIDLALLTEQGELVDNKWNNNVSELLKQFKSFFKHYQLDKENTLLCAEHTGQYGNKLVEVALGLELNLWMESPYSILHSQGMVRGKNDKVDAIRIAEYAKRFEDKAQIVEPCSETVKELKLLITERSLMVQDLAKYKGQIEQEKGFIDKEYFKMKLRRLRNVMSTYQKMISQIEARIDTIITDDPHIKKNYDNILSVEGVGKQTAIATIAATHNFKKFDNPRKFACHIGCAPFRYESGTSKTSRNRVSQKANKSLKKVYHMAALSTLRTSGELREYYERKVEEGKNKMSVINAIRSKLIHRIFAVVIENRKYEKNYTHSLV